MTKVCKSAMQNTSDLPPAELGASLIMVLMILIVVSLIGVGGAQIALMSERGSRNDRDMQIALQSAEAGLLDAVDYLTARRDDLFDGKNAVAFVAGCGSSGTSLGLCDDTLVGTLVGPKAAWLTVDFTDTSATASTIAYGTFTGKTFASGGAGVRPALAPRYVIELVPDPSGNPSDVSYIYRVTAMGFGPRVDIQAVLQMMYRP